MTNVIPLGRIAHTLGKNEELREGNWYKLKKFGKIGDTFIYPESKNHQNFERASRIKILEILDYDTIKISLHGSIVQTTQENLLSLLSLEKEKAKKVAKI